MKEGYIPQAQRKKILLLCDDIRMTSGISTMAREIVIGTAHHYNWVNIGGAITHPDKGKRFDLNEDTNKNAGITDASVYLYPTDGYGSPELIRQMMQIEKPDAIMIFTDPRYWIWLFQMEQEIRKQIPLIYLNIWDDLCSPEDAAKQIKTIYNLTPEERKSKGLKGREWATSKEAGFTAEHQGARVIEAFDTLFSTWKPREKFEFINTNETIIIETKCYSQSKSSESTYEKF